jgi:hypothetical protein
MRIILLAVPAVLAAQQPAQQPVDLIIANARIYR